MANLGSSSASGKKNRKHLAAGFADTALQEKYERIARKALYDLVTFHASLEEEMQKMLAGVDQGLPLDSALFERMTIVKTKYMDVMHGLKAYDDDRERHALIALADSVQDLMVHMHKKQGH